MNANAKKEIDDDGIYALYLYYFSLAGTVKIYETWDPANVLDPEVAIKALATNAAKNGNNPSFYTNDPSKMMMRRRSYVAFAVHESDFDSGAATDLDIEGWNHSDKPIKSDHTFANPKSLRISTDTQPPVPLLVVYCENWMISSKTQKKLKYKEGERFSFHLPFKPKAKKALRGPDSGGTNMGPPVPPPARKKKRELQ